MPPPPWSYQTSRGIVGRLEKFSEILFSKSLSLVSTSTSEGWTVHSKPPFSLIPFISLKSWFCILRLSLVAFRLVDFFSEKIIVGSQEAHYQQFLLQLPLTHYILRSIFFRTHSTPPICLKTQKCAILSTFSESGGKNHPKVGVRREKFNIGNCPQIFFRASYICWELAIKFL